jgi:glycosyltransferase involved in cell wall biosynthesis
MAAGLVLASKRDEPMTRHLAILSSHPIQYYGPLFRRLAEHVDLKVFFAHRQTPQDQARAGFGTAFDWDVDLTSGYAHAFLTNVSRRPGTDHFGGCDTPDLAARLRLGRFDRLLVMGWHLKSYVQGVLAAKRLGIPVLVRGDSQLATPRSSLKRVAKSLLYPHLLRRFDAALYVGARARAYYEHYCYPSERLFFSPHCVDTAWFAARATADARALLRARFGIAPETFVLLFAGKLVPFKRPADIVAAAASCRDIGLAVEIMVAGDGELRQHVSSAAASLGIPLHVLGFCNQTEMPHVYAASDVLILPSDGHETWGLVANEALACGRPVILSDACGCSTDLAADGRAGRMFPTGDISALAAAIRALIASPPPVETIAAVSERHGLVAAASGVFAALQELGVSRTRDVMQCI